MSNLGAVFFVCVQKEAFVFGTPWQSLWWLMNYPFPPFVESDVSEKLWPTHSTTHQAGIYPQNSPDFTTYWLSYASIIDACTVLRMYTCCAWSFFDNRKFRARSTSAQCWHSPFSATWCWHHHLFDCCLVQWLPSLKTKWDPGSSTHTQTRIHDQQGSIIVDTSLRELCMPTDHLTQIVHVLIAWGDCHECSK